MQICFRGDALSGSGYSQTNRLYVCGLKKLGYNVKLVEQLDDKEYFLQFIEKEKADLIREAIEQPLEDNFIYFNRTTVDSYKSYGGKKKFISTVWEVDPPPHYWVEQFNSIDVNGIIVPSKFNARMLDGKVNKPVHVLREGIDTDLYNNLSPVKSTGTFNFLSIFQWLPRKNYDGLIEAYFREFNEHDNVSLIIKTSSLNYDVVPSSSILNYVTSIKRKYKKNLPVYVLPTHVSYDEILKLYEQANCFISPSRAEGYNRPLLEAMAANLPVIATGWGGHTDFATNETAHLINYDLVSVPHQWYSGDFQPYQVWAEPHIDHLQYLMRQVYENKNGTQEKVHNAKKLSNEYNYMGIAKDLSNILFA